jgi:hypothetical protein
MGATLCGFRDARGETAAGNPVLQFEGVFLYHPAGEAAGSESQPVTLSFHLQFDRNRHGALLHADGGIASAAQ